MLNSFKATDTKIGSFKEKEIKKLIFD